ncbi:uncharacterized protein LOC123310020 isoform X2 [Coccinella septempunctata]|uniref:uncharacterized protein LOC123310020 isoform X2 n=1 Tax=Coccinella septempunctata TaxID=41139 RepID=UPI001D06B57F|nr:uncharacterized protein LOC123310020 isoform X2 [Coccinella septempunctata]
MLIQNVQLMKMTDNSLPSPIDLSVPKSTSFGSEITCNPRNSVNPIISPHYSKEAQLIYSFNKYATAKPNFNPTEHWLLRTESIPSDPVKMNRIIEGSMPSDNSSRSPQVLEPTNIQSNPLKENFEMKNIKRRSSNCSTSSSLSNFSNDSNNNENVVLEKSTTKKTDGRLSPQKKKSRTTIFENNEGAFLKTEISTPEQSRLGPSPTSSCASEIDHCDSSGRYTSTRPFKVITSGMIIDPIPLKGPLGDFETFRQNILSKVGSNRSTNSNMRRQGNTANTHITDPAYWEKRKKNNEAAKRSRDARRRKEDEIAIRCAYLEQERILMLQENRMLREALEKCHQFGFIR